MTALVDAMLTASPRSPEESRRSSPGLLRALIRDAGLDVEAFVRLVRG